MWWSLFIVLFILVIVLLRVSKLEHILPNQTFSSSHIFLTGPPEFSGMVA